MKAATFAIPLKRSRYQKPTPAPNCANDYGAIGKAYRERFGGPFFPCEQLKPVSKCDMCGTAYDPNTSTSYGPGCDGSCGCF